jgi:hypothetical protein
MAVRARGISSNNVPRPPVSLGNDLDDTAFAKLCSEPIGRLAVDKFAAQMSVAPETLRVALCRVYLNAADLRRLRKATKQQLKAGAAALGLLERALAALDRASVNGRGLNLVLLGSLEQRDIRGDHELNHFGSVCYSMKIDLGRISERLRKAIRSEQAKPAQRGENQKRLRSLVEELADWFKSRGLSLVLVVDANRRRPPGTRQGPPAVVHGRRGLFLELALALFSEVDLFKKSEVEAAVTNVNEQRLKRGKALI